MNILVTGGAGYLGSLLVPALLDRGHCVTVADTRWFDYILPAHPLLNDLRMDIRQIKTLEGNDAVIHLACVANDPSFDTFPELGEAVNHEATRRLVQLAMQVSLPRFIYASSSSVYGVKPDGVPVTEDMTLEPMTPYAAFKAKCEPLVTAMGGTVLRPATLCGYAPRQRLDVVVNLLTKQAVCYKAITIEGGTQQRANLHVQDMVRAYLAVLDAKPEKVAGETFNVGAENLTVAEIGKRVQAICGGKVKTVKMVDPRSYVVNSDHIANVLGFKTEHTIDEAIAEVKDAIVDGRIADPDAAKHYNLKQMQLCHIS